jgi:hypothetical protein
MRVLAAVALLLSTSAIAQEVMRIQATTIFDANGRYTNSDTFTVARKAADQSMSSTTPTDVVGLRFNAKANDTYAFHVVMVTSTAVGTTGIQFAINGPASPVAITAKIVCPTANGTSVETNVTAYETFLANGTSAGATKLVCTISGVLINGANAGLVAVRFKTSVNASAVTVHAGSWGLVF